MKALPSSSEDKSDCRRLRQSSSPPPPLPLSLLPPPVMFRMVRMLSLTPLPKRRVWNDEDEDEDEDDEEDE